MSPTSLGISRNTGPGRPLIAIVNALRMAHGIFEALVTLYAHFETGLKLVTMSVSCICAIPSVLLSEQGTGAITGMHPVLASRNPANIFATPGPGLFTQIPGLPESRECAMAMNTLESS